MAVDAGNAAALVVALADLVRDGDLDLTDVDLPDIRAVHAALETWLEGVEGNG
jgi:hypothetical protein